MVFYRKYRPQTIADLDSENVREILLAVLSKPSSLPHAFLFTGPKGLGKTSTARIVAKIVNCTTPKDKRENGIEPCNTCDECVSITNGTNIDVLEIDGASNRGIDEVRELRERVKLAPSSAVKKVYIIDEVHMLTTEAFNALLKTIEEPPTHVMFIFCTTEPQKVPATILSRCFHIEFKKATSEELIRSFKRIITGEKLQADDIALSFIASLSEGGFRDGTKILEEMATMSRGKPITKELVEEKYHVSHIAVSVQELLSRLLNLRKDPNNKEEIKQALLIISEVAKQGTDMKYFATQLLEALHDQLLGILNISQEQNEKVLQFTLDEIKILFELFSKAYLDSKYAIIPQLPLEIAIIRWSEITDVVSDEGVLPESLPTGRKNIAGKPNMDSLIRQQQTMKVKKVLYPEKEQKPKPISQPTHTQHDISHATDEKTSLLDNIIYKVKPYNHSVAGVLRGCKIKEISDAEIIFETPYKFHKERLEERKTCEIIEGAIKDITGKKLSVVVQLSSQK